MAALRRVIPARGVRLAERLVPRRQGLRAALRLGAHGCARLADCPRERAAGELARPRRFARGPMREALGRPGERRRRERRPHGARPAPPRRSAGRRRGRPARAGRTGAPCGSRARRRAAGRARAARSRATPLGAQPSYLRFQTSMPCASAKVSGASARQASRRAGVGEDGHAACRSRVGQQARRRPRAAEEFAGAPHGDVDAVVGVGVLDPRHQQRALDARRRAGLAVRRPSGRRRRCGRARRAGRRRSRGA